MTGQQQLAALQNQIWKIDNDYNLSVSSYVEAKDTREFIDIHELNAEIKTTVEKIDQLRSEIDTIISEIEA